MISTLAAECEVLLNLYKSNFALLLGATSNPSCLALTTGRAGTSAYLPRMAIETRNVIGTVLKPCSLDPLTGWHRDGCCRTGAGDQGVHVVCAKVNEKFLQFSKSRGNDLSTPRPEFGFPGLKPGNQWCLCAARWQEAFEAGCAPEVVLEATHESALEFIDLANLKLHAS